jgi:hypothetical protein
LEEDHLHPSNYLRWAAAALVSTIGLLPVSTARAGIITPDSISPMPMITSPAVNGTVVPAGGIVEDQYASLGIGFGSTALARINGILTFTPMGAPLFPPSWGPSGSEGKLNYFTGLPWGGVVQGVLVAPGMSGFGKSNQVSFEFINIPTVPPLALLVHVDLFDIQGNAISSPTVGSMNGPHGGTILSFSAPDISVFQVRKLLGDSRTDDPAWGIAQINPGAVEFAAPRVQDLPEPGTLMLGAVGMIGLLGLAKRSRGGPRSETKSAAQRHTFCRVD